MLKVKNSADTEQDGAIKNCTEYAPAVTGVTCQMLLDWYRVNIADFYAW